MTCGRLASEIACAMMSMPPTSVDVRMLIAAPSASNCAAISAGLSFGQEAQRTSSRHHTATYLPGYLQRKLARGRQHQREERLRLVEQRLAAAQARGVRRSSARNTQGCKRTCRIGSAKAPVLPAPVCASPMTSLPAQTRTMRASGAQSKAATRGSKRSVRTR